MNTNFAQPVKADKAVGRKRRRVLFIVLGIFTLLIVVTLFGIGRFVSSATQAKENVDIALKSLGTLSFSDAQQGIDLAVEDARKAQSGLDLIAWTQAIPWAGDHVKAIRILLDASIAGGEAFSETLSIAIVVQDILGDSQTLLDDTQIDGSYTFDTLPEGLKIELLRTLHQQSEAFYQAALKLNFAQEELKALDELALSQSFEETIAPVRELVPALADTFAILAPVAQSLDVFAGLDEDKQWMLLLLNNTEIRPGGGFMGVYGLVQISEGSIEQIYVDDTYTIDQLVEGGAYYVAAPAPLQEYIGVDKWYFRDANWSPDFAQSSQDAISLLRQEFAVINQPVPQIDGVIGFTPNVVGGILEMVGPLTVDGVVFDAETFTETLEYEVEVNFANRGVSFDDRKNIVSDLMDALLEELYNVSIEDWPALFSVVHDSFVNKQIVLYSADESAQTVFEDAGWSGSVDQGRADDVLMVTDANMAALKTDHAVEREVGYTIEPENGRYKATVSITYTHDGTFDYRTSRYRTYTRVWAPLGSEFISAEGTLLNDPLHNPSLEEGEADVQEELGLLSFGAFTSIEPGETGTLSFTYYLPESVQEAVDAGVYQLAIIKQIGAKNHALTLDLDFGKTLRSATPSELEEGFGDSVYQLNTEITQDDVITIEF